MKTNPSRKLGIMLAGVLALIVLSARAHAAALAYTVTDLGTLGGASSFGHGINASGQVAGYSAITGGGAAHAALWTGTTPMDLGTLGGPYSQGNGINASGQVAGTSYVTVDTIHAVRWTGTTPTDLGTLGGTNSQGNGINASGQVAGHSYLTGANAFHAVRWTGTTPTDLGTPLGGTYSNGYGINDSGQIAGHSYLPGDSAFHAVRWTGTTAEDLGTLGGDGGDYSDGVGINASGQVAGYSRITVNSMGHVVDHAVLWTGTTPTDLGTLPGGTNSYGYGINASGDVIGMADTALGATDAFLYTGGTMYDLNSLLLPNSGVTGLTIENAGNSINDLGQIAAYGTIGGHFHALRLDPVAAPEPASAVLMIGSSLVFMLRRRRGLAL